VTLPSRLLSASSDARVRVFVSDGFNEAIATSARFVTLGAPPTVAIASPSKRARVAAGGALDLEGSAYADSGQRLTGRALVWRAGRRVLGTGEMLVSRTLPAGTHTITLTARAGGRTASATAGVTVTPTPPVVTALRAPRRISARARSLTFSLASLTPATLFVGHVRTVIGRRQRSIRVTIRPGRSVLYLAVTLRSGRYKLLVPVAVMR
jgi:hypothetical protein